MQLVWAMAARYEKGLLDPENKTEIFDHNIWVIASDGDLQEGVSAEASSLAGTQALGNLKVIYDDNRISIEGDTHVAFTEDVSARYRSYGWEVFDVAAKADGDVDRENLEKTMLKSLEIKNKPVLIRLSTVIAWPAPTARGTAKSHGSALGVDEVAATKQQLGMDPTQSFVVSDEVIQHARAIQQRGAAMHKNWLGKFESWQKSNTVQSALLNRLLKNGFT
jgi:transketolase